MTLRRNGRRVTAVTVPPTYRLRPITTEDILEVIKRRPIVKKLPSLQSLEKRQHERQSLNFSVRVFVLSFAAGAAFSAISRFEIESTQPIKPGMQGRNNFSIARKLPNNFVIRLLFALSAPRLP